MTAVIAIGTGEDLERGYVTTGLPLVKKKTLTFRHFFSRSLPQFNQK
jgi:hypothetical protein